MCVQKKLRQYLLNTVMKNERNPKGFPFDPAISRKIWVVKQLGGSQVHRRYSSIPYDISLPDNRLTMDFSHLVSERGCGIEERTGGAFREPRTMEWTSCRQSRSFSLPSTK